MTSQSSSIERRAGEVAGGGGGSSVRSAATSDSRVGAGGRGDERVEIGQRALGVVVGPRDQRRERVAQPLGVRRRPTRRAAAAARPRRRRRWAAPAAAAPRRPAATAAAPRRRCRGWSTPEGVDGPAGCGRADAVERAAAGGTRPARRAGCRRGGTRQMQVLDVGRLEEAQAAVLHVGDAPARQLELEQVAVVRGPDQHRLLPQRDALLAVRQDLLAHRVDLRVLVGGSAPVPAGRRRRAGRRAARAMNPSGASAPTALATSRIGWPSGSCGRARSVVDRREHRREVEQVAGGRRPGSRTRPASRRPRPSAADRRGAVRRAMSTWSAFTSWYSSTRCGRALGAGRPEPRGRQRRPASSSSRSSKSSRPSARLRAT